MTKEDAILTWTKKFGTNSPIIAYQWLNNGWKCCAIDSRNGRELIKNGRLKSGLKIKQWEYVKGVDNG